MPTQQNLVYILIQLKQLNLYQLQILKREINSLISSQEEKDLIVDLPQKPSSFHFIEMKERDESKHIHLYSELIFDELLKALSGSFKNFREKNDEVQIEGSAQKPPRPLGIWKGQVEVSNDFYETSSDILSEFGMEE